MSLKTQFVTAGELVSACQDCDERHNTDNVATDTGDGDTAWPADCGLPSRARLPILRSASAAFRQMTWFDILPRQISGGKLYIRSSRDAVDM